MTEASPPASPTTQGPLFVAPGIVPAVLTPAVTTPAPTPSPSVSVASTPAPEAAAVTAQLQQGITLNLNGVATKARGEVVNVVINKRSYVDLDALPSHLRVLFDDEAGTAAFDPRTRQLLIVPLDDYRKLFGASLVPQFDNALTSLESALATPDLVAQHKLTLLPASGWQYALATQIRPLTFHGGSGVRFVTQFTQEITPVTSSSLTYVFQGLTSDGAYLVAGYFPITSSALAPDLTQVPKTQRDQLKTDYSAYLASAVQTLNTQEQSFKPTLQAFDVMLASLTVSTNPLARPVGSPPAKPAQPAALHPTPSSPGVSALTGRALELLNVRNAPNTRGRILGQLNSGEPATLLGRSANSQWIRVRTSSGLVGWISRQYLDTSADLSTLPIAR